MQSRGVEILLVEDNANDAELTLRALKQRNLASQVHVCRDGAEAMEFFQGGASHYGVSDVAALARDTHKFESRYLDWLIGPFPQEAERYRERSPLFHADRLSKPVIFFQGDEDEVVPPNQAEVMVESLRRKGNPVGYFLFSGEQHGFRKAANIQRCLEAELAFYAIEVFKIGLRF